MTANEFAKFIAKVLDESSDFPTNADEADWWTAINNIAMPVANTIAIRNKQNGEQFLINVKKVK